MPHDAGLDGFAGDIDGAAEHALRADRAPLPVAGIDAFQTQIGILAVQSVEIPPRHAVLRRDDRRRRAEQRLQALRRVPALMRLQGDDDIVLRAQLGRIARRRQFGDMLGAAAQQLEALRPDRVQMIASCDNRYVRTASFQHDREITTNGSRTKNTNFHIGPTFADGVPISLPLGGSCVLQLRIAMSYQDTKALRPQSKFLTSFVCDLKPRAGVAPHLEIRRKCLFNDPQTYAVQRERAKLCENILSAPASPRG